MFKCCSLFTVGHIVWFTSAGAHLQRVRLGEVGRPSDPHGDPHVDHLGRDVAERQVADHLLLRASGVLQTHVVADGERRPRDLRARRERRVQRDTLLFYPSFKQWGEFMTVLYTSYK